MIKNEIKLDKNNNFSTKYGTTLADANPSVLYLRTKSKITPFIQQKDYALEIEDVKDKFVEFIKKTVLKSKSVQNEHLFTIEISNKGVKWGKVSNLRYDLYVRPTKLRPLEMNLYRMKQLSIKLDKKLEQLLNANKINCC